jgi:hypothetical protein
MQSINADLSLLLLLFLLLMLLLQLIVVVVAVLMSVVLQLHCSTRAATLLITCKCFFTGSNE